VIQADRHWSADQIDRFPDFQFTLPLSKWHDHNEMSARLLHHVDEYLAVGQQAGASDIHLGVNAPPIWRLHGTLRPIWPDAPRFKAEQTKKLADAFLTDAQRSLIDQRGDADFAYARCTVTPGLLPPLCVLPCAKIQM
jgi:hypothetical protein